MKPPTLASLRAKVNRTPREKNDQKALIKWFALARNGMGVPSHVILFMIPNGSYLGKEMSRSGVPMRFIRAQENKAMGLTEGIPDLFLSLFSGVKHGLFIEVKRLKGGATSDAQKLVHNQLRASGYEVIVGNGFIECAQKITDYCVQGKMSRTLTGIAGDLEAVEEAP